MRRRLSSLTRGFPKIFLLLADTPKRCIHFRLHLSNRNPLHIADRLPEGSRQTVAASVTRHLYGPYQLGGKLLQVPQAVRTDVLATKDSNVPVSYTHLTLPTIYSV